MPRISFAFAALALSLPALKAQTPQAFNQKDLPPRLIVAITVDQMRADYLTRYEAGFGEDGFRRMFDEGFAAMDHHFGYAPTYTGPGHASISTGTTPAIHGVISNNWYSRSEGRVVYCAEDTLVTGVGMPGTDPGKKGQMSPGRMQASGWADELKLHFSSPQGPNPIVIGASMKDRGAILPPGTLQTAHSGSIQETSSRAPITWRLCPIGCELPSDAAEALVAGGWALRGAPESYQSSMVDTPYEGKFKGIDRPTLPTTCTPLQETMGGWTSSRAPRWAMPCWWTSRAQPSRAGLGEDDTPDVLALSFSGTDYVGHQFGAHAMETEDTYRRLDDQLARLFDTLDDRWAGPVDGLPDRRSRSRHRAGAGESTGLPVAIGAPRP